MSLGVFSDFSRSASASTSMQRKETADNNVKPQVQQTVQPVAQQIVQPKTNNIAETIKAVAPIAVPLIAIPVTAGITYKLSNKNVQGLKTQLEGLAKEVARKNTDGLQGQLQTLTEEVAKIKSSSEQHTKVLTETLKKSKKSNAQIWSALIAAAGLTGSYKAGKMSKDEKAEVAERLGNRVSGIDTRTNEALHNAHQALSQTGNSLGKKYVENINGIQLLTNSDSLNKNAHKYEKAVKTIEEAAPKYLYQAPDNKPLTAENPTIWSVTSEFAPIKEGGLGSVPVEIQNNVTKLGIDIPTFIPMYQQKGISNFKHDVFTEEVEVLIPSKDSDKEASQTNEAEKKQETTTLTRRTDRYTYTYKGKEYELKKAASFKLDTYQNGHAKTEDVEIYVSDTQDKDGNNKQLIFVKNDNYFNGTIYQPSEKCEEPEKFAFFSKAVYELAKAKNDIHSVKGLKIEDREAFNSIKAPDAFILNDWQASPIAALARYKAPMENAYGQLSDEASEKLSKMRIITIGHNTMYQGSTGNNGKEAERHDATTNILNTLFDNFTYDIVKHAKTGASATDPADDGLKNLDNVLILNAHAAHSNHTNLLNMGVCLSDYFHPVSQNYAQEILMDEHKDLSAELRWALNQKNNAGSLVGIINGNDFNNLSIEAKSSQIEKQTGLRFATYNKESDIDDVIKARLENKISFYNSYMMPFSKKNDTSVNNESVNNIRELSKKLEFVDKSGKMTLPILTASQLAETPVLTSVGRMVSQKGIDVLADSINMLMKNWDKDFPGKPKPIFYIAGQDGEGGKQRAYIEDLKGKKLSKEDSDRVIFAHGFAPMAALTASSDFFMMPSVFEPCGLTQGESFALGTPVIGSAVGGIVDTVNRDGKTNGILTDKDKPLTAEGFYKAMKEGLTIYFEDKEKYKGMVKDALAEDFSWIKKGKQGPVYDYLEKLGIDRSRLPDAS